MRVSTERHNEPLTASRESTILFPPLEDIVIVPPQPDAFLSQHDVTHAHLCFEDVPWIDDCDAVYANSRGGGSDAAGPTASDFTPSSSLTPASNDKSFEFPDFNSAAAHRGNCDDGFCESRDDSGSPPHSAIARDPSSAFTFRVYSEYDMLLHVQRDLDWHRREAHDEGPPSGVELSEVIMGSIDEYCLRKQRMYHIGREKGAAVGRFLREGAEAFARRNERRVKTFVCVDLGTYCGYSALMLAVTLCRFLEDRQRRSPAAPPFEFSVYTTEVSAELMNVAQSVFRLAGMERRITPVLVRGDGREWLSTTLAGHGASGVDFLLLDHARDRYLADLRDLEDSGLLSAGSRVGADDVALDRPDAYRDHVRRLASRGVTASRLEEVKLECGNNAKDGVEMTLYLEDPPVGE